MTDVRCSPRQTDIWINQYCCHWVKSNSSSHVLCAGCSRLLILSGGTTLTSEPLLGIVLMQIRRGNQFNVAQFDQTSAYWASAPHENLPILTLPPSPSPSFYAPYPHQMRVAPHDPKGSFCPCGPAASPFSSSSTLLTLSGLATIPDPAPETGRLEFKVNVPFSTSVCRLPSLAPVPYSHAPLFSLCFLTKNLEKKLSL